MINKRFEAYKIQRELRRSGATLEFKRSQLNAFGEPVGEPTLVGMLRCLYHEQSSYVKITTGDTTQVRSKKVPMLLCSYEAVAQLRLRPGDQVTLGTKTFKVTGIVNVQEWNIVADISLEVVDIGVSA